MNVIMYTASLRAFLGKTGFKFMYIFIYCKCVREITTTLSAVWHPALVCAETPPVLLIVTDPF